MTRIFLPLFLLFFYFNGWAADLAFQSFQLSNEKGDVSIQMPQVFVPDEKLTKKMNGTIYTFVKAHMWPDGPQADFPQMTSYEAFAKFASAWLKANQVTYRKEGVFIRLEMKEVTEVPGILSLVFQVFYDTGGAHPNKYTRVLNLNLKTGEEVSDVTSLLTYKALHATDRKEYLQIKKEELKALFKYRVGFAEAGLRIIFSPYDVAAYVAGDFSLTIDYDQFKGLWNANSPFKG